MTIETAHPAPTMPELNEPQARAVAHLHGPLVVFAGAGSGKTRVITYRIANLLAVHRVPPYRVLAVTFTNKAAGEMKKRLVGLVGEQLAKDLWVGTFHATCAKLLRRWPEAAGLRPGFSIYDESDQKSVIGRIIKDLGIDDRRYPPRQVLARIHMQKQEGRLSSDFEPQSWVDQAVARCFAEYDKRLRDANAVDFDDLLLYVLRIAEDRESPIGDELRRRFRHVLVDEFQDVNMVQYRLVRALVDGHDNLCVVGDDDQSIYRWRGADVRILRRFKQDFPNAEIVKLEQNYRSTGCVVKAALGVIRRAREREPKELWTAREDGEQVLVVATESERDEAGFVVERVRELVERGVSPRDIAVFYRVHAQSRVLEEAMRAERIPYQVVGGVRFFERAEVKDLLSYLRLLVNPASDVDLIRIVNVPSRKIGDGSIEKLAAEAAARGMSMWDAIDPVIESGALRGPAVKGLCAFQKLVRDLVERLPVETPSEIAARVLEETGYKAALERDGSVEAEGRLENVGELVGSILDYEQECAAAGEEATLAGYLERVTLASDADSLEDAPKVALMTVHAAKGLEFDTVFLTGMEEDMFPFRGLDPAHAELEEERRLAYVAITRARERLVVTHAQRRMIFGMTRFGRPSRFVAEMPPSVVRQIATPAAAHPMQRFVDRPGPEIDRGRAWQHPQAAASSERPVRTPGERYVEREDGDAAGWLHVLASGTRVRHATFGTGVLLSMDPGDDPIATVKFPGQGVRRIKARFLKPE